jgi:hypothetical protein
VFILEPGDDLGAVDSGRGERAGTPFRVQRALYLRVMGPPNKRMQLTKLRAAPVLRAEVPPCAPAGGTDGGTASQLIRSVRQTLGGR